ncbi:protein Mpv17, putative [Plasmodium malariae]|nr:protein Mpv17, putative [Plasmodium malariae]SBT86754.1 protein Mpv17, putative [Plasmodium malariae]
MLTNAYMGIKRRHIKVVSKNVNSPFVDYNFKRHYFAERCTLLKYQNYKEIKLKNNRLLFTTNINLKEFKIAEMKRSENKGISEKTLYTLNNYIKRDKLEKRLDSSHSCNHNNDIGNNISSNSCRYSSTFSNKNSSEVFQKCKFVNHNLSIHGIVNPMGNSNIIFNIKTRNISLQVEIRRRIYTMSDRKNGKSFKRNVNVSENASNTSTNNASTNNSYTNNTCKNNTRENKQNVPTNAGEEKVEKSKEFKHNIDDLVNIKNVKKKEIISSCNGRMKKLINNLFEKHLLLMNCLIAGVLYFIADIACQIIEAQKRNYEFDLLRTLRMAIIGLTLEGPIMTWWYGKVLANFIQSKPNTFLYKSFIPTIFDNFIFGPVHLTIFFFYNGMLKNQRKSEIIDKIVNTGMKVFFISLMTWTPLTLINFVFIPRIYQATVVFFADFFWVIFLSWCANKK